MEIQVQGIVVQHANGSPSHTAWTRTLGDWLTSEGVPAITGIDTRSLTRRLQEHGTIRGWLVPGNGSVDQQKRSATGIEMQRELFGLVAPRELVQLGGDTGPHVLLVDVGAKDNLVHSLLSAGCPGDPGTVARRPPSSRG
jgi:carbamoyl-phosphate synthase small subunit